MAQGKTRKFLAFDLGAESGRAIVGCFDGKKVELEVLHRFPNQPVVVMSTTYWDVLRLFYEMKEGLSLCMQKYGTKIASMAIDTWGVDFGLLGANDELLGNPIHYRDPHTEGMIEEAFKVIPRQELFRQTGNQFIRFNTLFQLMALARRGSSILDQAKTLLLMPNLFDFWFTGRKLTEYSIASTTQMVDPRKRDWAFDLLRQFSINGDMLTEIVEPGTIVGKVMPSIMQELGSEGADIPVVAPASHDTGSAVAAVPSEDGDYVYISSGTWSLMGVEVREPIMNEKSLAHNFTNEGGFKRSTRVLKNIAGLWLIQETRRQWSRQGEHVTFAEMEQEALASRPFAGLIDPDDPALAAPGDIPERIREICRRTGQVVPGSRGEIVRCIYESLALKYRVVAEQIEKISGCRYPVIHVVGGGAKDELLSRFTANATGIKVIAGPAEGTALGNIAVQLIASGAIASLRDARRNIAASTDLKHYQPEDTELWEAALIRYRQLFPDLV